MVVEALSVNLDKPNAQFSPGQALSGKLFVRVSGNEKTTEIIVRFYGSAYTHWKEQERREKTRYRYSLGHHGSFDHRHRHTTVTYYDVDYQGNEVLFDLAIRLFGDGVNTFNVPPGDNVYPFSFTVPVRPLPVSCHMQDGVVSYGIEGHVRQPWFQVEPRTQMLPVTICMLVDLTTIRGAGNPIAMQDSKDVGCCCSTGLLSMKTFTPKLGWCSGEVVPLVVEVNNTSGDPILALTAVLTQMWTLFADGPRGRHDRQHPVALQSVGHPGLGAGQSVKWEVSFTIPSLLPASPDPNACSIVKLDYNIQVNAAFEGTCGKDNLCIMHPVIVGSVPLAAGSKVSIQPQTPKYDEKGGLA